MQVTEVLQPGKGVHLPGWFFVELGIVNITCWIYYLTRTS